MAQVLFRHTLVDYSASRPDHTTCRRLRQNFQDRYCKVCAIHTFGNYRLGLYLVDRGKWFACLRSSRRLHQAVPASSCDLHVANRARQSDSHGDGKLESDRLGVGRFAGKFRIVLACGAVDFSDRRIDLLADGELSDEARCGLLARLDRESDGWRRCALAFLEAQAWRGETRSMVRETVAPIIESPTEDTEQHR